MSILLYDLKERILCHFLILAFFSSGLTGAEITSLSFDADAFKQSFNAAADKGRLIVILAPT